MTTIFKARLFLISILINGAACNLPTSKNQYKGFENAIDIKSITPVLGTTSKKILNINIPVEGTMSFDYNKSLKDIHFIKLENTPESTIANIDKTILTKDRIIIVDFKIARGVFIFDFDGRFINSILSANAVIDKKVMISNFLDVAYDYQKEELILHDQNKSKMYYFDKNGNFKNNTKEYLYYENFANIQSTDLFIYLNAMGGNDHIPALAKSTIYIGEKDTRINHTATGTIKQMRTNLSYSINHNPSITNSNKTLLYTPEFCDTVYEIKGNPLSIYPRVVVHYPGADLNSTLKATRKDDLDGFLKLANTGQYYSFQGDILSNDEGIYYITAYKKEAYGYFYSEKTKKLIGGDLTFRGSPIDTVQSTAYKYPTTTFNSYFVSILSASDFSKEGGSYMSTKLAGFKKKLKPGVNPVLLFYKLKDF